MENTSDVLIRLLCYYGSRERANCFQLRWKTRQRVLVLEKSFTCWETWAPVLLGAIRSTLVLIVTESTKIVARSEEKEKNVSNGFRIYSDTNGLKPLANKAQSGPRSNWVVETHVGQFRDKDHCEHWLQQCKSKDNSQEVPVPMLGGKPLFWTRLSAWSLWTWAGHPWSFKGSATVVLEFLLTYFPKEVLGANGNRLEDAVSHESAS